YGLKKSKSTEEIQDSSSGDYSIDLKDNIVIYENNIMFNMSINNFSNENKYKVTIKVNNEVIDESYELYAENTFQINFKEEGKENIAIIVYKNDEESGSFEKNIYYVEPYQSQFLD